MSVIKILYIPEGRYLHFNYIDCNEKNANKRTCNYMESQWYQNVHDKPEQVIKDLVNNKDCYGFAEANNLPNKLLKEEFEIVYD